LPQAAAAPATVSGELIAIGHWIRSGKAAIGTDPRARRPADEPGCGWMHRSGRIDAVAVGLFAAIRPFAATAQGGDAVTDRAIQATTFSEQAAGAATHNRRFACPGLFRIVPSRDGGICRIKLPRGLVTAAQLRTIAAAAARFGQPTIEATNRSNIQIRGVKAGREDALIQMLVAAGLGPRDSGADDVRNVMVSPVAGIDPTALVDVTALADAVLTRLESEEAYHALSPKFSVQIDGGESVARTDHPNDIWLAAADAAHFAVGLGGCPGDSDGAVGVIAVDGAEATLFDLLDLFLPAIGRTNSAGTVISRMRHLLVDMPAAEIAARLPVAVAPIASHWRRASPMAFGHIGVRAQAQPGRVSLGAVPPLGRMSGAMALGLADLAEGVSGGEIRMTPWQSILLPNLAPDTVESVCRRLEKLGFITKTDRALAGIVTCAGSAGCRSGLADTKTDALALGALLDQQKTGAFGLHLTGCGKSCAAPRPAPVTLLAVAPGRYDVFLRTDTERAGFGERAAADLTIEQAGQLLAQSHTQRSSGIPERET